MVLYWGDKSSDEFFITSKEEHWTFKEIEDILIERYRVDIREYRVGLENIIQAENRSPLEFKLALETDGQVKFEALHVGDLVGFAFGMAGGDQITVYWHPVIYG